MLFIVYIWSVKAEVKCGTKGKGNTRIVGGRKARKGAWPWQVTMKYKKKSDLNYCGGSIIARDWIVTASHCFQKSQNPRDYTITVGKIYDSSLIHRCSSFLALIKCVAVIAPICPHKERLGNRLSWQDLFKGVDRENIKIKNDLKSQNVLLYLLFPWVQSCLFKSTWSNGFELLICLKIKLHRYISKTLSFITLFNLERRMGKDCEGYFKSIA